jgi:hypothetical protein
MGADYFLHLGDRLPRIRAQFVDADNVAIDLTTATSVTFNMVDVAGTAVVTAGACTVVTPASGIVEYAWAAGDVDTAGDFFAQFVATFAGLELSAPNDRELWIVIS